VRLLSGDGASVGLRPVAYQFSRQVAAGAAEEPTAAEPGTDWDANWLMIRGDIRTSDGERGLCVATSGTSAWPLTEHPPADGCLALQLS